MDDLFETSQNKILEHLFSKLHGNCNWCFAPMANGMTPHPLHFKFFVLDNMIIDPLVIYRDLTQKMEKFEAQYLRTIERMAP